MTTSGQKIECSARATLEESLSRCTTVVLNHSKTFASLKHKSIAERKIRLTLLKLGGVIRRNWKRSQNEGSRADLRGLLEEAGRLANRTAQVFSNDLFVEALKSTPADVEVRYRLHDFEIARPEIIEQMKGLASLIPAVIAKMDLSGSGGRGQAFHTVRLSSKGLLSVYAITIFTELRITERPPGVNNLKLIDFLTSLWCLATNASETDSDWSTHIKIARVKRKTKAGRPAHISARLEAADFVRELLRDLEMIENRGALLAPNFFD